MTRILLRALACALPALLLLAAPTTASAESWVEGKRPVRIQGQGSAAFGSATTIQLRQDLGGALEAPIHEDLYGAFFARLPGSFAISGMTLMRVGALFGKPGAHLNLYLLQATLTHPRRSFQLTAGRQLLRTPEGLRMIDGVVVSFRPALRVRLEGAAGWVRNSEVDQLTRGALMLQASAWASLLPATSAQVELGFRAGPEDTPRLDVRLLADAVIPAPLAPRLWVDSAFRLDQGKPRHLRGGVVLTPNHLVNVEVRGRLDQVTDQDGTLSQQILAELTKSPVASLGAAGNLNLPGNISASAAYWVRRYQVRPEFAASGHGIDAAARWSGKRASVRADYMFRNGYGGSFHSVSVSANLRPHRIVDVQLVGQVAPYSKLRKNWRTAHSWRGDVGVRIVEPLELRIGGEYRSGAVFADDLRLNAAVILRAHAGRAKK